VEGLVGDGMVYQKFGVTADVGLSHTTAIFYLG
jgi:hypothetical protein